MKKIIINVPNEYKYYNEKFFQLLNRTKNFVFLIVVCFLLIYSNKKQKNKISVSKKIPLQKINKRKTKVCICTLGKNENRYIKEFLNHYKKLGVDKVFLHDNNDIAKNSESFDDLVSDFIKEDFVEIINYMGKPHPQFKIYSKCYQKNKKKYDWIIFFDIDEFIHLENYSNIKDFLDEQRFNKCKLIYFNCLRHTDNDLLFYDNRTLETRFPYINWKSKLLTLKTIARGNIKRIRFHTSHWLDRNIRGCNVLGDIVIPTRRVNLNSDINKPEFKLYYIDHYCFKSTEEYINKINKGDGIYYQKHMKHLNITI